MQNLYCRLRFELNISEHGINPDGMMPSNPNERHPDERHQEANLTFFSETRDKVGKKIDTKFSKDEIFRNLFQGLSWWILSQL